MFAKLKELFFGKPAEKPAVAPAPYKIETPDTNWPFPKTIETAPENHVRVEAPAPVLTVDGHGDVHEVKPAKKSAAKKTADKTPAVKKASAKKKSAE